MIYRIGQRVRLLHQHGEGVITDLLDKKYVEVDIGDDFPVEVHIDDLVAVEAADARFWGNEKEAQQEHAPKVMGNQLFEISLLFAAEEEVVKVWLVNPEPITILYTIYVKVKGKYSGYAAGKIDSGSLIELSAFSRAEFDSIRELYTQTLGFKAGKGHPHGLEHSQHPLKNLSSTPSRRVEVIRRNAWAISLRKVVDIVADRVNNQSVNTEKDLPVSRSGFRLVDIHIEELHEKPHTLASSEIMEIQLKATEEALSKAIAEGSEYLIIIHGVGTGILKKAVRDLLKNFSAVDSVEAGDPNLYGNGATKVWIK